MDYDEVPFSEVVDVLEDKFDIQILFDNAVLDELAISPETEITISLRNMKLRSVLNHMIRQPGLEDLTYIVEDEVLLITTEEKADAKLSARFYRVDCLEHFLPPNKDGEKQTSCYSPLQEVLTDCVEYDSWQINGTGEGEIHLIKPGIMIVMQT